MWKQLQQLLSKIDCNQDTTVLKEKLGRRKAHEHDESEDFAEVLHYEDQARDTHAIPENMMINYWKERSDPSLIDRISGTKHHVIRTMETSETLLQPGVAENYPLVREHPVDEFNAWRQRQTGHRISNQFIRKSGQFRKPA